MWYNNIFGNLPLNEVDRKKLSKFENDLEFQNNFSNLLNSSLEIFEWDLPETCDERSLELSLLYRGQALFAYENGNLINLMAARTGDFNIYGNPLSCYGYAINGWNKEYNVFVPGSDDSSLRKSSSGITVGKKYNSVFVRDNSLTFPYLNYLIMYSSRMTNLMRSIDVLSKNLKYPVLVTCEESYKKSVEKLFDEAYDNNSLVISAKGMKSDFASFDVLDMKTNPNALAALWDAYDKTDSCIKQILGIDCISNVNKKAQMLSGELSENNSNLEYNLEKRLKFRKEACKQVKDAFGIDIDVRIKHEIETDEFIPEDAEGGEDSFDGIE